MRIPRALVHELREELAAAEQEISRLSMVRTCVQQFADNQAAKDRLEESEGRVCAIENRLRGAQERAAAAAAAAATAASAESNARARVVQRLSGEREEAGEAAARAKEASSAESTVLRTAQAAVMERLNRKKGDREKEFGAEYESWATMRVPRALVYELREKLAAAEQEISGLSMELAAASAAESAASETRSRVVQRPSGERGEAMKAVAESTAKQTDALRTELAAVPQGLSRERTGREKEETLEERDVKLEHPGDEKNAVVEALAKAEEDLRAETSKASPLGSAALLLEGEDTWLRAVAVFLLGEMGSGDGDDGALAFLGVVDPGKAASGGIAVETAGFLTVEAELPRQHQQAPVAGETSGAAAGAEERTVEVHMSQHAAAFCLEVEDEKAAKKPTPFRVPFEPSEEAYVRSFVGFLRLCFTTYAEGHALLEVDDTSQVVKVSGGGLDRSCSHRKSEKIARCLEYGLQVCRESDLTPSDFWMVRGRMTEGDETPGTSRLVVRRPGENCLHLLNEPRMWDLTDIFGILGMLLVPADLAHPHASDDDNGVAGGLAAPSAGVVGSPRYSAAPDVGNTSDEIVFQLFGPEHCVETVLDVLAGWPVSASRIYLPLGPSAWSQDEKDATKEVGKAEGFKAHFEVDRIVVEASTAHGPVPKERVRKAAMDLLEQKPHVVQRVDMIDASAMRNLASPRRLQEWAEAAEAEGVPSGAVRVVPVWHIASVLVLATGGSASEDALIAVSRKIREAVEQWRQSHISILLKNKRVDDFSKRLKNAQGEVDLSPAFVRRLAQELGIDLWLNGYHIRSSAATPTFDERKVRDKMREEFPNLLPDTVSTGAPPGGRPCRSQLRRLKTKENKAAAAAAAADGNASDEDQGEQHSHVPEQQFQHKHEHQQPSQHQVEPPQQHVAPGLLQPQHQHMPAGLQLQHQHQPPPQQQVGPPQQYAAPGLLQPQHQPQHQHMPAELQLQHQHQPPPQHQVGPPQQYVAPGVLQPQHQHMPAGLQLQHQHQLSPQQQAPPPQHYAAPGFLQPQHQPQHQHMPAELQLQHRHQLPPQQQAPPPQQYVAPGVLQPQYQHMPAELQLQHQHQLSPQQRVGTPQQYVAPGLLQPQPQHMPAGLQLQHQHQPPPQQQAGSPQQYVAPGLLQPQHQHMPAEFQQQHQHQLSPLQQAGLRQHHYLDGHQTTAPGYAPPYGNSFFPAPAFVVPQENQPLAGFVPPSGTTGDGHHGHAQYQDGTGGIGYLPGNGAHWYSTS